MKMIVTKTKTSAQMPKNGQRAAYLSKDERKHDVTKMQQ